MKHIVGCLPLCPSQVDIMAVCKLDVCASVAFTFATSLPTATRWCYAWGRGAIKRKMCATWMLGFWWYEKMDRYFATSLRFLSGCCEHTTRHWRYISSNLLTSNTAYSIELDVLTDSVMVIARAPFNSYQCRRINFERKRKPCVPFHVIHRAQLYFIFYKWIVWNRFG